MKTISSTSKTLTRIANAFALVALCSCNEDRIYLLTNSPIGLSVTANSTSMLKSGPKEITSHRIIPAQDGGYIEEFVSDYPEFAEPSTHTKGAVITTSGHNAINTDGQSFHIEGWLSKSGIEASDFASAEDRADYHFLSATATRADGVWDMGEHFWRNAISTTFWSYYQPAAGTLQIQWPGSTVFNTSSFAGCATATDAAQKQLMFKYALPAANGSTDALASKDFVIAYNNQSETPKGAGDGRININFHHPLAAVRFFVTDDAINSGRASNEADDEYVKITKIELIDIATEGTFTATGSGSDLCTITCNAGGSPKSTYAQNITRSQITGTSSLFTSSNSDNVFFMIPQDLSGVKARITIQRKKKTIIYEADGETVHSTSYSPNFTITDTKTVSLSGSWMAGKTYTYKISAQVLFGGETLKLTPEDIYSSDPDMVNIVDGDIKISAAGSISIDQYVAPLNTKGVQILKLTINHTYTNNSGKSYREIWLENAVLNPAYVDETTTPGKKYISTVKTTDADLVAEAKSTDSQRFSSAYTGKLGDVQLSGGGKYVATANDHNMNNAGGATNIESTLYFYLGGRFDQVKIHFLYGGTTGGGSIGWTVDTPIFNITKVVD